MAAEQESGGEVLEMLYEETTMTSEVTTSAMQLEYENNLRALYLDSIMKTRNTYASYFGGCYLKNGELVVKLTDVSETIVSYVNGIVGGLVEYEKCSVSLGELKVIKSHIENYIIANIGSDDELTSRLIDSIVCVSTDIVGNAVCVSIKDCSKEQISLFKKMIIDSEYVTFRYSEGYVDDVVYVKPGEEIIIMVNGESKYYSMGFRCKKLKSNGTYAKGFVTAAHGGPSVGDIVYTAGWQQIGSVLAKSYSNGGKVDAVFVEVTNSNYDCSNTIYSNGTILTAGTATLSVGSSVSKYGYSTALTSGEISDTDASLIDNGITITNLYEADYMSAYGDSGCVVFDPISKLIAGIHKGRDATFNKNKAYFVKTSNIRSSLGVTLY